MGQFSSGRRFGTLAPPCTAPPPSPPGRETDRAAHRFRARSLRQRDAAPGSSCTFLAPADLVVNNQAHKSVGYADGIVLGQVVRD